MKPVDGSTPSATLALALLVVINLFNYIDRQVLAAVEPEIREELDRGLRAAAAGLGALSVVDPSVDPERMIDLSEEGARSRMGLLSTAFLLTYMFLAPLFGWLADHYSRWKLIGIGVILWSLASGASGWDWQLGAMSAYLALLVTRCFVGVGEGGYGPVAPAMLADLYPVERRGQIMAWFYLAIPVGGALGYAFGEVVKDLLGWRWAFFLVVPPGVLLGAVCFLMRDPPRGQAEQAAPSTRRGLAKYTGLFRIPSYVLNTLGMTAMTFAIGGLAFWMPDFLERHQVPPLFGISPRTVFGGITALSGLLATLAGGWVGDRLRKRYPGAYFLVSGVAMLVACPMILGFLRTPFPAAWILVFLAVFCLFFNTGPTNTILANVTHPAVRASGFALNILIIHALGDAISPPILGFLDGRYGGDMGFFVVGWVVLLGGALWLWGAIFLERDTQLAGTRG